MKFTKALFFFSAALSLSSCSALQGSSTSSTPDQANLCEVKGWQHDVVASACKPGQKVVFLPETFGNEQLPIIFAAVNCDHRYSVALTTGGVSCIYGPITPAQAKSETKSH
jgi:hypothetical protein